MSKYQNGKWNEWTDKSSNVPFEKSGKPGIGHGEEKLGEEFDTKPLGQNKSHDLDVNNEKWEVKKADGANSFRLGVEVAEKYSNLLFNVLSCFHILDKIKNQLISKSFKEKINKICLEVNLSYSKKKKDVTPITIFQGLHRSEVSESNLIKLNDLLENLKKTIKSFDPKIMKKLYSSYDGKEYEYTSLDAVAKINLENISEKHKLEIFKAPELYDQSLIHSGISEYLDVLRNETLKDKLDTMVRSVFNDVRLVLVLEKKGYRPLLKVEDISCVRITSGGPRCKVNNS